MREQMIAHLVCPETGSPLTLEVDDRDDLHIISGRLISQTDPARVYPIVDGIPQFVPETADMEDQDQAQTVDTFSYKWTEIPEYADEDKSKDWREEWYFQRFGFPRGDKSIKAFLEGKERLLEAGTGAGVDTDLLTRNSHAQVFGIDISWDAIRTAFKRFEDDPRVFLSQADLGRLPFPEAYFDLISCDQVLHHTPNPPEFFKRLVKHLAPGGHFLLYVYAKKSPMREFADDYLREQMISAPMDEVIDFCKRLTRLGRSLSDLNAMVEVEDDLPELGIMRGVYDVQRLIHYTMFKCFWNADLGFWTSVMVNFDWYRPMHAFRYAPEEVRPWFEEAGLEITREFVNPSGISYVAHKPA